MVCTDNKGNKIIRQCTQIRGIPLILFASYLSMNWRGRGAAVGCTMTLRAGDCSQGKHSVVRNDQDLIPSDALRIARLRMVGMALVILVWRRLPISIISHPRYESILHLPEKEQHLTQSTDYVASQYWSLTVVCRQTTAGDSSLV